MFKVIMLSVFLVAMKVEVEQLDTTENCSSPPYIC